jgi:hypothetical protein
MGARRQNNRYITPDYALESGSGPIPSGPKLGVDYVPMQQQSRTRQQTSKPPVERLRPKSPKMP